MIPNRLISTLVSLFVAVAMTAAPQLFSGGRSDYKKVLSEGASTSEQTAARELRSYLKQVSGADIPVVKASQAASGKCIYIGFDSRVKAATGADKPADE